MLRISNLTKRFNDGTIAVNNLNLKLEKGEIYVLLGANGAGKTTTINLIFNFLTPTEGNIYIKDIDAVKYPLKAKQFLAYVSENVLLYENFTAVQNLAYFSKIGGKKDYSNDYYKSVLERVGIPYSAMHKKLRTFSKGMRQKCGIAIAIAKDADVIILDEPTSGLDPKSGKEFIGILGELKNEGKTIFMTSHDIFRAREISDRIGIMKQGKLLCEMTKKDIQNIDLEALYVDYMEDNNITTN
jgi:ABC-2 type transport system ATP-binding protein